MLASYQESHYEKVVLAWFCLAFLLIVRGFRKLPFQPMKAGKASLAENAYFISRLLIQQTFLRN